MTLHRLTLIRQTVGFGSNDPQPDQRSKPNDLCRRYLQAADRFIEGDHIPDCSGFSGNPIVSGWRQLAK
jgi:hypothetical protein